MTTNRTRYTKVLQWGLAPMLGLAAFIPAITWDAPEGDFTASPLEQVEVQARWDAQDATPTMTNEDQVRHPDCHSDNRGLTDTVLVATLDGTHRKMGFDEAWGRGHDTNTANDIWVIGFC